MNSNNTKNYLENLKNIKAILLDVDGVLTDGSIILLPSGEQVRTMQVKDGYALQLAVKKNIRVAVITGGKNVQVKQRLEGLGIYDVHLGVSDKLSVFKEFLLTYQLKPEECLYMGDDIPDYEVMSQVAIAACPADATPEIIQISHYVTKTNGGKGCVREVVEKVLRAQNKWFTKSEAKNFENFTW